ncbi:MULTISPECIES: hypothetical protein [unclassified Pseudodesulfovibrio]|uniref:hypothetical protein n=1 Tax=unclassified Pseudodesulfovibrio TaxID=2661612 RepID=UPI000FEBFA16|nr:MULTISPECIES: hypothetical protein [unclassified Pseudodesulfovibrio]MCJ2163552.1 hypothetical protein [Pseudodesulfovibrio sp. S3-i]RWU06787.1 hypothetical protein DWB63_03210 [Pseudodesulfovibrio sp. S3]
MSDEIMLKYLDGENELPELPELPEVDGVEVLGLLADDNGTSSKAVLPKARKIVQSYRSGRK